MRWTCTVSLLFALACSPVGPSPGDDAATNPATDAGATDHHVADSGRHDTGNRDTGGRDRHGFDASGFDIMAFDIAGYELGMREYDGSAEPGVVCNGETCTTAPCCAGLSTACATGGTCTGYAIPVPCDGNEDCDAGICVVSGSGIMDYSIHCVAPGAPDAGRAVCVTTSQCDAGGVCCSAAFLSNFGLELGWCETTRCGN